MEWDITIDRERRYVEIVSRGTADPAGSEQMAEAISTVMRQNRITRAVVDHRLIERVTGTAAGIYNRPKFFRFIGVFLGIRIAEVVRPEHVDHFKFLETVCLNRGFSFSVFFDRESAMAWLFRD